jgi:hypothetical protein
MERELHFSLGATVNTVGSRGKELGDCCCHDAKSNKEVIPRSVVQRRACAGCDRRAPGARSVVDSTVETSVVNSARGTFCAQRQ